VTVAPRVRVGVSSWADPALIEHGGFYPRRSMTAEARLRFYASVFDTVEINASYYAIPDPRHARQWAERTPDDFVFHVKAYALLTGHHPRWQALPADVRALLPARPRLTPRGEVLASEVPPEALEAACRLFRAALAPLEAAGKLGYVLFQLAPWVHFTPAQLDALAALPARFPGWTLAVECRHRSWFPAHAAETLAALRAAGLAHVIVDGPTEAGAVPRVAARTARVAVFRLHGRNAEGFRRQRRGEAPAVREKYDYLYSEEELRGLLPEVQALAEEAEQTYVSFNNNNRDYPVRNALMLRRLLGQPAAAPRGSLPRDLFA
jgi:uncharacterized protein YecE (DUF72 family)